MYKYIRSLGDLWMLEAVLGWDYVLSIHRYRSKMDAPPLSVDGLIEFMFEESDMKFYVDEANNIISTRYDQIYRKLKKRELKEISAIEALNLTKSILTLDEACEKCYCEINMNWPKEREE